MVLRTLSACLSSSRLPAVAHVPEDERASPADLESDHGGPMIGRNGPDLGPCALDRAVEGNDTCTCS